MVAWGIMDSSINKILEVPVHERLPSKCIELISCEIPLPKEDQVQVKIYGAGINFNSIWQSICHPLTPRALVDGHIRRNPSETQNKQNFYIFGSDGAGIITAIGKNVVGWKIGDEVVIHCNYVDPLRHSLDFDQMLSPSQSIWGYETNYGSFADYTCVNQGQLLKKPAHLSWPEAGSFMLTLATAYRMLISQNGAQIRPGEICLIWGASGGLGGFAIQLCNMIGAIPVGIVSSGPKKIYCESLGCKYVLNLEEIGTPLFVQENGEPNYLAWKKLKNYLTKIVGSEIDVVFEHIGRETIGLSVYLMRKGGRVVTCAASSGFMAQIDLRYLWMDLKRIIGSHFANFTEAAASNQLVNENKIKTTTESIINFEEVPTYLDRLYLRKNIFGKVGIRF